MNLTDLPQRVQRRIALNDVTGCWDWTGYVQPHFGHGRMWLRDSVMVLAHRFVYEQLVGPIPEGLVLDHLCRVPKCVNPIHLEPVTQTENMARGMRARKTHCPRGHEYTDENTRVYDGSRYCRACMKESVWGRSSVETTCRFPGCRRPSRPRVSGRGRYPIYCDLPEHNDSNKRAVAHRRQLDGVL